MLLFPTTLFTAAVTPTGPRIMCTANRQKTNTKQRRPRLDNTTAKKVYRQPSGGVFSHGTVRGQRQRRAETQDSGAIYLVRASRIACFGLSPSCLSVGNSLVTSHLCCPKPVSLDIVYKSILNFVDIPIDKRLCVHNIRVC